MVSFIREIRLNTIRCWIQFDRLCTAAGTRYFVYVTSEVGESCAFDMENDGKIWRIMDAPWVSELYVHNEERLSALINEVHRPD